jgi:phage shock protein E
MRAVVLALVVGFMSATALAQEKAEPYNSSSAQIDYSGFRNLTGEVEAYRAGRLISMADFHRMAAEPNTIVLDARSADAYAEGHIDGAINLPFTDFTEGSLREALRDPNVRILIYCNNNFSNNEQPVLTKMVQLALNIQTFINLYGYGYRNVYELGDIVDFNDPAVGWVQS